MNPFWGINIKERFLGCIFLERQHLRKKPLRSSKSSSCDHRSFLLHIFRTVTKKGKYLEFSCLRFFPMISNVLLVHYSLTLEFKL